MITVRIKAVANGITLVTNGIHDAFIEYDDMGDVGTMVRVPEHRLVWEGELDEYQRLSEEFEKE